MASGAYKKALYRDPKQALIGGVCAGIAERLDVDVILVRVAAIVAFVLTFGLVSFVYLVLWTVLPIRVSQSGFIEIEPSSVRSEYFGKVVTRDDNMAQTGRSEEPTSEEGSRAPFRNRRLDKVFDDLQIPFMSFILLCVLVTLIGVAAAGITESNGFVSFLPLYIIPFGVFLFMVPNSTHSLVVRACIVALCIEASAIALPFTMGIVNYESMSLLTGSTFLTWLIALIFLIAAFVFENTACYLFSVLLIFMAIIVSFYDFGLFSTMIGFTGVSS